MVVDICFYLFAVVTPTLDPNDPLLQIRPTILCHFHPYTSPKIQDNHTVDDIYNIFRKPLDDVLKYIQRKIKGINKYLIDYKEKVSPISKSQLADIILHPDTNKQKIQTDLEFYENLFSVESELIEKLFSGYEVYYGFNAVLFGFSRLKILGFTENDTNKIDLIKASQDLARETEGQERCSIGECPLCCHAVRRRKHVVNPEKICTFSVSDLEACSTHGYNNFLSKRITNLCYYTGKMIFDTKQNFSTAIELYLAAYTKLTHKMKDYKTDWETLGDDFYE